MDTVKYIIAATMFLACGSSHETRAVAMVNLGTAHQPIYMPAGYGRERDGSRCIPPWDGGFCKVPDWGDKELKIRFVTNDCDAFTRDRIIDSLFYMQAEAAAVGWTINIVTSGQNGTIRCSTASGAPGSTSTSSHDNHSTQHGTLIQYKGFEITIRPRGLYECGGGGPWLNATEEERGFITMNVCGHELAHVLGLGHADAGTLMATTFGCTSSAPQWESVMEWTDAESDMLRCYNPNSGTGDAC